MWKRFNISLKLSFIRLKYCSDVTNLKFWFRWESNQLLSEESPWSCTSHLWPWHPSDASRVVHTSYERSGPRRTRDRTSSSAVGAPPPSSAGPWNWPDVEVRELQHWQLAHLKVMRTYIGLEVTWYCHLMKSRKLENPYPECAWAMGPTSQLSTLWTTLIFDVFNHFSVIQFLSGLVRDHFS